MKSALRRTIFILFVLAILFTLSSAQQTKPPEQQPANPGAAAHYDRMAAAKTVFLKNAGGNDLPFNVISRSFESWARYILVDAPDKADLIIEIQSPDDSYDKDKDLASKAKVYGGNQQKQEDTPKPSVDVITLTVFDKNKKPLWIGREEPRFAMKHKAEEARLIEAAQKLFNRFHDRVEPPAKP